MKNLFLYAFLLISIISCNSNPNDSSPKKNDVKTEAKTVDKIVKTKKVIKMPAKEATEKFGIDFEENLLYSGSYEYYEAEGKEVLNGKVELQSNETMEEYIARMIAEKGEPAEDDFSIMHAYTTCIIKGQYIDGIKEGKFIKDANYYEATGLATITFDAESNSCSSSSYDGMGEGYCFKFEGKLPNCTFEEITNNTKEVECE